MERFKEDRMTAAILRYCVSCWTFDGTKVEPTKLLEGLLVCKACYASMPPKARLAGGFAKHLRTAKTIGGGSHKLQIAEQP